MGTNVAKHNMQDLLQGAYDANQAHNAEQCLVQLMLIGQLAQQKYGFMLKEDEWQYKRKNHVLKAVAGHEDVSSIEALLAKENANSGDDLEEDVELQKKSSKTQAEKLPLIPDQDKKANDAFDLAVTWWALSYAYEAPYEVKTNVGAKPMAVINRLATKEEIEIGRRAYIAFFKPIEPHQFEQELTEEKANKAAAESYKAISEFKTKGEKKVHKFGRVQASGYAVAAFLMSAVPILGIGLVLGGPMIPVVLLAVIVGMASFRINKKMCWNIVPSNLIKLARDHFYSDKDGSLKKHKTWKYVAGILIGIGGGLCFGALSVYSAIIIPTMPGLEVLQTIAWLNPVLWVVGLILGLVNFVCLSAAYLHQVLKYTERESLHPKNIYKNYFKKRFIDCEVKAINSVKNSNTLTKDEKQESLEKLAKRYKWEKRLTVGFIVFFCLLTAFGFGTTLFAGATDFKHMLGATALPAMICVYVFSMGLALPGEFINDFEVAISTVQKWASSLCDWKFGIDRNGNLLEKNEQETINKGQCKEKEKCKEKDSLAFKVSRILNAIGNGAIPVLNTVLDAAKKTAIRTAPMAAVTFAFPQIAPATIVFVTLVFISALFNSYTAIAIDLDDEAEREVREAESVEKIKKHLKSEFNPKAKKAPEGNLGGKPAHGHDAHAALTPVPAPSEGNGANLAAPMNQSGLAAYTRMHKPAAQGNATAATQLLPLKPENLLQLAAYS